MSGRPSRRSPLAMALLALLAEAPTHAYRLRELIRERRKDQVVNVAQRNSVYQTLDRLLRDELVQVRDTERVGDRPERTVYELTDEGAATLDGWLREMLSTPAREFPEFPAALAFLPLLTPDAALTLLARRAEALRRTLADLDAEEARVAGALPRVVLLEGEYQRATALAELRWLEAVTEDLRTGALDWNREDLDAIAARFEPRG
ncbi:MULTISPECIES: PadR family transcriptional regulator [Actinoalloteichus]|uniref:PadR family transcriptional regulator n=1 Tax=Actinoalloteichus TaxID=65496 RepID=UPI00307C566F